MKEPDVEVAAPCPSCKGKLKFDTSAVSDENCCYPFRCMKCDKLFTATIRLINIVIDEVHEQHGGENGKETVQKKTCSS